MTEVLSDLNQQQLQKLIQYAVSENPAAVMPALFKHIGKNHPSNILHNAYMINRCGGTMVEHRLYNLLFDGFKPRFYLGLSPRSTLFQARFYISGF